MDENVRRIPQPPASTRDKVLGAVLTTIIVVLVLLLVATGVA